MVMGQVNGLNQPASSEPTSFSPTTVIIRQRARLGGENGNGGEYFGILDDDDKERHNNDLMVGSPRQQQRAAADSQVYLY